MTTSPYKCCNDSCRIFHDDFSRTGEAGIGCQWNIVSGSWEIDNQELQESNGSGVAVTVATHPEDDPTCLAFAQFEDIQAGNDYMVLVNYADTGNYLYGRYYWDGGDTAVVSVGEVSGGVASEWDSVELTPYSEGNSTRLQ